ncbi:DUF456 family protein [Gemmatimonas sp.]|uniref:DUF456 family protein n=1 Tax=Gemmatimonas sp. TaxID=1962908 RepID=UPI003DA5C8B7
MFSLVLLMMALVAGLVLVALGLPGLWVMLGATLVYWLAVPAGSVGLVTLLVVSALVAVAEVVEFTVAGRYARQYGGSRRASWGAVLGGLVGAVVGVPVPVLGSMLGAFAGAFAGALVAEFTVPQERRGVPLTVAKGALVGRVVAAALKVGFGLAIVVWVAAAALVGRWSGTG